MSDEARRDEEVADELLSLLRNDQQEPAQDLPARAIRKVQASLTGRDLIDLTTIVFVLRFCAPLLDLVAAFFAHESPQKDRRHEDD